MSARSTHRKTASTKEARPTKGAPCAGAAGPRPPSAGVPKGAALELARWGFARLRALVADFVEEAEAIDRVAAAVEASIVAGCTCPLQIEETDLLTTASILITAIDPDDQISEAVGVAFDLLTHGVQCERTPTATPLASSVCVRRRGAHRPPLTVRHLRLVP